MGLNFGLLWILSANAATTVFVPVDPLVREQPPEPERAPVPYLVDALDMTVQPGAETKLTLRWTLTPLEPGWVDLGLVDRAFAVSDAKLDGGRVALAPGADGLQHLTLYLNKPTVITLRGSVVTPASRLSLRALGGVRQRVQVEGPWEVSVPQGVRLPGGRLLGGDRTTLNLDFRPAGPPAEKPPLMRAEVSSAARLDSGGVELESVIRYRVVRGGFETLQFRLDPSAEDLDVEGDGVVRVDRQGELVNVRLGRPLTDHLVLRVRCRRAGVGGAVPLPWPIAAEAEGWATLNRGDESLIVPTPGAGAQAVSNSALPPWARGLAEGAPIVSYHLSGDRPSVSASALRWEPIDGPPTVVDEARYEVASADHGRLLFRARYQVRNDRRQFLRVTVPDGLQLISVMVAGHAVQAARDDDGTLLIPLEKSVETLQGLVTFPVDIAFWGEDQPWQKKGVREALTPAIDAPIAYARWEMVLPPGFSGEVEDSTATEVPDWSSRANALQYGRAYGDGAALDRGDAETQFVLDGLNISDRKNKGKLNYDAISTPSGYDEEGSQQAWNEAYTAYKQNRFDESKELLERSIALNPDNQAAHALSGNLDVLLSETAVTGEEEVAARRVKDMAKARTGDAERQQEVLQSKADEAIRAGNYEEAEKTLEQLVRVSGVLASVEQSESVDKKAALSSSSGQLDMVRRERGSKSVADEKPAPKPVQAPPPSTRTTTAAAPTPAPEKRPVVVYQEATEIDFASGGGGEAPSAGLLLDDGRGLAEHFGVNAPTPDPYIPDATGADEDLDYSSLLVDGPIIEAAEDGDGLQDIDDLEDPNSGLDLEELPARAGYATVILNDSSLADGIENGMVLEPDIAALLFATDVTGWTGEEGLHTEVVIREASAYGMGSGSAYGSGYGAGGLAVGTTQASATTAGVVVPRGGQILRFEARLVPEGQPLSATLSYRSARKR